MAEQQYGAELPEAAEEPTLQPYAPLPEAAAQFEKKDGAAPSSLALKLGNAKLEFQPRTHA